MSSDALQIQNMCYYDNYRYHCADWKWGNFRQHCQKEYRTGETCGSKLIYQTIQLQEKCSMCDKIDRKLRRYNKLTDDYKRWEHDPQRQASKSKAAEEMTALYEEIQRLSAEKQAKQMKAIGGSRRG